MLFWNRSGHGCFRTIFITTNTITKMDKGYKGIKNELTGVRKSRDSWKRKYHQLNNLYAQLKENNKVKRGKTE